MVILKSRVFWGMVAALLAYVVKLLVPAFPLDEVQILGIILFVLGLFNIYPELRSRGLIK